MSIGVNWKDVWKPIWKPIWRPAAGPAALAPDDCYQEQVADSLTLSTDLVLQIADAVQEQVADGLVLGSTSDVILVIDSAVHLQAADQLSISAGGASIVVPPQRQLIALPSGTTSFAALDY